MRNPLAPTLLLSSILLLSPLPARTVAAQGIPHAVIDHVSNATAFVKIHPHGDGSAFCIREDGLFITNNHVVAGRKLLSEIPLVLHSGVPEKEKLVTARLLNVDVIADLAILKADGVKELPVLNFPPANDQPKLQQPIFAFGFPFGVIDPNGANPSITVNGGKVTSLPVNDQGDLKHIRFDAAVNLGNSGGPLVDRQGRVVGVVSSKILPPGELTSFAVPAAMIQDFLKIPGVLVHPPKVDWNERDQPAPFRVKLITEHGATRPDQIEVLLKVGKDERKQTFELPDGQEELTVELAPYPQQPVTLALGKATPTFTQKPLAQGLKDQVIHAESQTRLQDLSMIQRLPDNLISLRKRNGDELKVPLERVQLNEQVVPANNWQSHIVHIEDEEGLQGTYRYIVTARTKNKKLYETWEEVALKNRPLIWTAPGQEGLLSFPGDAPRLEDDGPVGDLQFHIPLKGRVKLEMVKTGLDPPAPASGLVLDYPNLYQPPGDFDLVGPFIQVNGRLWHHANWANRLHSPNFLPVDFQAGKWEAKVVRYHPPREKIPIQKDEILIEKNGEGWPVVSIKTPKNQRASYGIRLRSKAPPKQKDVE